MRRSLLLLSVCVHGALVGAAAIAWAGGGGEPVVRPRFGVEPTRPAPAQQPPEPRAEVRHEPVVEPPVDEPIVDPVWTEPQGEVRPPDLAPPRLLPMEQIVVRREPPPAEPPAETTPPPPVEVPASSVPAPWVEPRVLTQHNRPPDYPETARRLGHEGEVRVGVRVGADGAALEVWLESACRWPELNRAALQAVRGFRFEPARENGAPTEGTLVVPVVFRLTG